jgi:predicted aspartyl protease
MMTGYINENLEPLLEDIFIEGTEGDWIALRTILDTGFNGEFCLPKHYVKIAQLEFLSEVEAELADGRVIIENVYLGSILVNQQPQVVEITLTDSETAAMGMMMMLEQEAVFNLKTRRIQVS